MQNIRFRVFCAVCALILATTACVVPSVSTGRPTAPKPADTAAALTDTPAPSLPAPSDTPIPADTDTPLPSNTPTLQVGVLPSETPTPTLEPVVAEIMKETTCRIGPGNHYDLVNTFQAGTKLEVEARDLGGGFIFVKNPDNPDAPCYILANNARVTGDDSALPQYTPLPSPTLMPSFTAVFKKWDVCKGNYFATFIIQNVGSVAFRSAYIRVVNTKNNESAEKSVDAFDLYTGCIIAKNIAPLDPGATGYLASELFKLDPRSYKARVVIHACTEKGLKGTCIDVGLEIKP